MTAYYNEFDPYAAQWLRNLIEAGHIAPGIVDERSIEDVRPADLAGFTQCHFFAGVGVWSLALRKAGWPDDKPVWTGSCPCQPFSAAGAGPGFKDARHLWPSFAWLIGQSKPPVIFGEQVASKAVEPWVDLVHADLEALEYAFGAVPFPSAGVGAPHIRDRLFWVADDYSRGRNTRREGRSTLGYGAPVESNSLHGDLAYPDGRNTRTERKQCGGEQRQQSEDGSSSELVRLGDTDHSRLEVGRNGLDELIDPEGRQTAQRSAGLSGVLSRPGPTNGNWRNVDWISCRDGKRRPIEPSLEPLVNGATGRVGRLRAYGNAINAEAAHEFIAAYLDGIDG